MVKRTILGLTLVSCTFGAAGQAHAGPVPNVCVQVIPLPQQCTSLGDPEVLGITVSVDPVEPGSLNDGDTLSVRITSVRVNGSPVLGDTGAQLSYGYVLNGLSTNVSSLWLDYLRANGTQYVGKTGFSGTGTGNTGTIWLWVNGGATPLFCYKLSPFGVFPLQATC